jgi:FkbM family methyltransferase
MSFNVLKVCAKTTGCYPAIRWLYRQLLNREELRRFHAETVFYSQFVHPGQICFDVGANFGAKTEAFLRIGATVVAFEPQKDCFMEMVARLGKNPRLIAINAAVGSRSGEQTLYVENHRTASSLIKHWQGEIVGTVKVPVKTLDEAIAQHGQPQYCKIDVEGYEMEVLKGLSRLIPFVSYEYHLRQNGAQTAIDCLDYLSQFGELLVNISPAEMPILARQEWWSKEKFIEFFHNEIPHMPEFNYGDIFVRTLI